MRLVASAVPNTPNRVDVDPDRSDAEHPGTATARPTSTTCSGCALRPEPAALGRADRVDSRADTPTVEALWRCGPEDFGCDRHRGSGREGVSARRPARGRLLVVA